MQDGIVDAGGVPVRYHDPGGGWGTVLVGHGGGESKDSKRMVRLCQRLAIGTGLAAICMDAVDHGDRRPTADIPPGLPARWHSTTAPRMAADWAAAAAALGRLGPPRAYVGVSMGAIFGPTVVAALPRSRRSSSSSEGFRAAGSMTRHWSRSCFQLLRLSRVTC